MSIFLLEVSTLSAVFYQNNDIICSGKTEHKWWKPYWILSDVLNDAVCQISNKRNKYKANFIIDYKYREESDLIKCFYFYPNERIEYETKSGNYLLCFHRGNKFSLFKEDTQIGTIEGEVFSMGSNEKLTIILKEKIDDNLFFLFSLIYCAFCLNDNYESFFFIRTGPIFNEYKKIDTSWTPY